MAVAFDVEPLTGTTFVAKIHGIKIPGLDEDTFQALYQTWLKYAVLIFPGQNLSDDDQKTFARRFGPLEVEHLELSNVRPDGQIRTQEQDGEYLKLIRGNESWHCDGTFMPIQAKGAVFRAGVLPKGGTQTGFADMRAAYDALDDKTRAKVETLTAYHSIHNAQAREGLKTEQRDPSKEDNDATRRYYSLKGPPPRRSLVKVHPETGRKVLLLGRHAYGIPGMTEEESEKFLKELNAFAVQPPRIYYHDWSPGDVVLWDNRSLLHRAVPWDLSLPRVMWHSRIAGDPVTEAALA